jgi:branched-subunit amino acid transport protein
MTPIGHIGIALPTGYVLTLSLPAVFLGVILPDLIDKPLEALGIGGGRYIAHTLMFAFVVAGLFSLWKRKYGLSVLLGMISHLFLDLGGFVPWFYPFESYESPQVKFDPSHFFSNLFHLVRNNAGLSSMGKDLIWVIVAAAASLLGLWLRSWFRKRRSKRDATYCQTDGEH